MAAENTINNIADSITLSVWTGVLAGIVTSVLIGFARQFWSSIIKPAVEDILYRDAKIEGRWKAQFSEASADPQRVRRMIANARKNEQSKLLNAIKQVAEAEKAKKIKEQIEEPEEQVKKEEATPENSNKNTDKKQSIEDKHDWLHTFAVTLERKGHIVRGTMLGTTGGNEGRNYVISGSFRNLILTGTYESTDRSEIERGCFALMLKNNGSCLHGYIVAYSDNDHELGAIRTTWSRHRQAT